MPSEHLMKDDDDFEEDTLFDQAGLLTNKIKKHPDSHNVHNTMRITPMKTFALCLAFFGLGISFSILEPTLLDLQYLARTDSQRIFYTVSARSIGYFIGLVLGMFLFDRYNRQFLLFLVILAMTVFLGILPWCNSLIAYIIIMLILGALMQLLYAGGNVLCLDLWGRQSGPFLQAIHFSLSIGLFVAPLLSNTITAGNTGLSVSESSDRIILNNTFMLALPASALYSIHFRLPALQSRSRRSINSTAYLSSFDNATFSELGTDFHNNSYIKELNITLTNSTHLDYGLTNNSSTALPLEEKSVLTNMTTESYGNVTTLGSLSQTVASNTTVKTHKPKPEATFAKNLPNHDPWERNHVEKPVPIITKTITPSTVSIITTIDPHNQTTVNNLSVKPGNSSNMTSEMALQNSTSIPIQTSLSIPSVDNDTGIVKNLTDDSIFVDHEGSLSTSDKIKVEILKNDSTTGETTASESGIPTTEENFLYDSTNGTLLENGTDDTSTYFDDPSADRFYVNDTSTNVAADQTNNDALSPSSTGIGPTSSEISKIESNTFPEESQNEPTSKTFITPKNEELPQDISTTVSSQNSRLEITTNSKNNNTADKAALNQSHIPVFNHTKEPILSVEDLSTVKNPGSVNCSMYKTGNDTEGNKTLHETAAHNHKKPNTFNNQTEESQMLLSDLLNKITELGMTKVHIVYAVMSVIVFLTSLVFLSFLCQNPRELRSKQEEGVKAGVPESKFTSIMVGLTFVLMIFYTMAQLVFSQLYLSLVLQQSAHLLHSRGSLLVSVFWGIYTFSRATSICCTNGFKPVTMLLLDFGCCIFSAATLSIFGSHIESVLWCSVAGMSIGLSSIFPYCLLWLEDYIHISNKTTCIILMGNAAVDLVISFTFGRPISLSASAVMYLVLFSCIFALLIFGIMWRLATWRGDKYGFSKADTQYHLASQVDDEEDSIEFASGNSSLYLLNGGTPFPLSSWDRKNGNSYIPLQHNSKWK